jgi:ATP-dependent DNA helicase RecQ
MKLLEELRTALEGGCTERPLPRKPNETWTPDYAVWRFLKARQDRPDAAADCAVLLRQALRWSGVPDLTIRHTSNLSTDILARCGITFTASGKLIARSYERDWDTGAGISSVLDAPPIVVVPDETAPAEPWLELFPGHSTWRSLAQKQACWTALTAPEGGTTLIALPTGAGKSLAFQVATRYAVGLTLVIVPTIALALDHKLGSAHIFKNMPDVRPMAYEANSDEGSSVRQAIRERTTRLVFTSPEACISGSLRGPILDAAKNGWLRTVVIDEAHIVETWGADFRVDFQLLSSAVAEWRQLSMGALRTLLLSATFSDECRKTLRDLFSNSDTTWSEFVSQRLRPEMNYFVRSFLDSESRKAALAESLFHLPRPAIVYATEVEETTSIYEFATRQLGFQRVELFTGETRSTDRKRILESWRSDETDLVIATSAFGMGVDKRDVRAVVHACVPESLDRYYQEVGRGGRDGASVTCLLIPSSDDWNVARSLVPTLLGDEKVRLRWAALWGGRRAVEEATPNVYELPLHSRHSGLFGARSYSENIRWNKRLILLLARSGRVRLLGLIRREEIDEGELVAAEWARVEILFSTLQDVATLISERRSMEMQRASDAIDALAHYVSGENAICRVLQNNYGTDTSRACGSCPSCRTGRARRADCRHLELMVIGNTRPDIELVTECPNFRSAGYRDELVMLVRKTVQRLRIRRFFCGSADYDAVRSVFVEAFGSAGSELYRLDVITNETGMTVNPSERLIAIHGPQYLPKLEQLNNVGLAVTHWVPAGMLRLDANGRQPMISEGASLIIGLDQWIASTLQRDPIHRSSAS